MRRLFNFIFQLVAAALIIFLLTAVWIVLDGLNDSGGKADVALVTGRMESPWDKTEQPFLDHVAKLYTDGEFPFLIVSVSRNPSAQNESDAMTKYLESKGVPANVILADSGEANTQEMAHGVAETMRSHQFESVMIVTDYYRMTLVKLELTHEGIAEIGKAHVGKLQKEDAWEIGREVVALYEYIGNVYLLPAAKKVKEEAQTGADKAKVDAENAKEKVDKGLESLPK